MAITYKWDIREMNAHIKDQGQDNVIFNVHWNYTGSEESGGKTYIDGIIGSQQFTYKAGDAFVPYANTEAFENVVIGWLESALDMVSIKASIDANIQKQITPVNENLYFTWKTA
jgi:hypothetical protein